MDWIDIHEPRTGRKSSLSFGGKRDTPGCFRIVGGLSHNAEVTMDKKNAQKLVDFLNKNIIEVYK